ncbi:nuclear transport factor 2 family protein [Streptomyces beijiangensis]|uniref:Nuclear transport factor 2 family protein n=1 Tax=Streptomyces beijiangensis TaxID=163361 RepID=A0A939JJT5_9ACTN|nr:nuclear transport factor 2 family protein [Streptomyces beijiangensis]MBO0515102.1 nuclear transport factor 2 family protein [Streptomyces beijiangensis]
MDVRDAAQRFVRVWESGWKAGDADTIAELYAEDCVHRSMPFRAPHRGRAEIAAYIRWSFAGEHAVDVRFGEPLVTDSGVAVAEFLVLGEEDGQPTTLAGCVLVRFREEDGLAVETRDYWHSAPGHLEPEGALGL